MDARERAEKIREGNQAFNEGNIRKAREIFIQTDYKDGLVRMGDYFMYEKKLPLLAFGYYKRAGQKDRIEEIMQRMVWALGQWIGMDKIKVQSKKSLFGQGPAANEENAGEEDEYIPSNGITVHPLLKKTAIEILERNKNS